MTGVQTCALPISAIAVFALVRRPIFALYIVLALVGSLASGLLYQAWIFA